MTKFKFKLEPVLQHRESKEKQAVLAQADAQQKYFSLLDSLNKTRDNFERSLKATNNGDCFDILNNIMYRQYLKNKMIKEEKKVSKAHQQLQKCRKRTLEARKQKLIMEKLKENQLAHHIKEENSKEQKQLDEMANQIILRNQTYPF